MLCERKIYRYTLPECITVLYVIMFKIEKIFNFIKRSFVKSYILLLQTHTIYSNNILTDGVRPT